MSQEERRLAALNAAALANAGRGLTSTQLMHVAESLVRYLNHGEIR